MGYGGKVVEQQRARELRAAGWTYTEIATELRVSKSSVSLWCRDVEVDERAWARRVRANRNFGARARGPNVLQRRKADEIERCRSEAALVLGELSERDLFIAGIALYAGEGTKVEGKGIGFTNTDPRMIALFLAWLRQFFDVDESRLRVRLYLHADLDLEAAVAFWSEVTGIPPWQFHAPYRAVTDNTMRRARHVHGCVGIVYCSALDHRRVLGLTEALLSPKQISPG
jgi:hypothetical protein